MAWYFEQIYQVLILYWKAGEGGMSFKTNSSNNQQLVHKAETKLYSKPLETKNQDQFKKL